MTAHVEFDVQDAVAWIRFARPEKLNAQSVEMLSAVTDLIYRCEADAAVRAVVFTGTGRGFTGGFDLAEIPLDEGDEAIHRHFRRASLYWHSAISGIIRLRKPVLAAVNGATVGGGVGLVLASDIAIASAEATFTPAWFSIGISIDTGSSCSLPSYIGWRRATEWVYTNRTIDAREALEWGLLNRVVPADALESEARRVAVQLANGPTRLYGLAKELFHRGRTESPETQYELEREGVIASVTAPEFAPRLRAFRDGARPSRGAALDLDGPGAIRR